MDQCSALCAGPPWAYSPGTPCEGGLPVRPGRGATGSGTGEQPLVIQLTRGPALWRDRRVARRAGPGIVRARPIRVVTEHDALGLAIASTHGGHLRVREAVVSPAPLRLVAAPPVPRTVYTCGVDVDVATRARAAVVGILRRLITLHAPTEAS